MEKSQTKKNRQKETGQNVLLVGQNLLVCSMKFYFNFTAKKIADQIIFYANDRCAKGHIIGCLPMNGQEGGHIWACNQ